MDKENVVCTHNGILFSFNKGNLTTCNNEDKMEDIMLSEISQIQNDRYYWVGQKVCLGVS